ncbi:hypothetical protein DRF65_23095 [Chryseobacterium pennae]|uniref:Uncharacterized protein n=1 Tax=Chryseobacterium pennae TaxID=2258962 RepID=A0A3D9C2Y0_9FLAO|nr:hypothetical protein DRF65_23095 [Chryseobacterium pennae]
MAVQLKGVVNSIHVLQDGVAMAFVLHLSVWNKINHYKLFKNKSHEKFKENQQTSAKTNSRQRNYQKMYRTFSMSWWSLLPKCMCSQSLYDGIKINYYNICFTDAF